MLRTPPSVACQYCGAVFRAGNHTTRLEPRLRLNKKLRKLMTRQQSGEKLGRFQQKVVTMYIASNNRVVSFMCNFKRKKVKNLINSVENMVQISIGKQTGPGKLVGIFTVQSNCTSKNKLEFVKNNRNC